MNTSSKLTLKQICCTCLCTDRRLFQLCKVIDGVNHLYHILSSDAEAYSKNVLGKCLTELTKFHQNKYTHIFDSNDPLENTIVCTDIYIKTENTVDRLENVANNTDYTFDCESESIHLAECKEKTDNVKSTDLESLDHRLFDDDRSEQLDSTDVVEEIDIGEEPFNQILHLEQMGAVDEEKQEYYTIVKESEFKIGMLKKNKKLSDDYTEAFNRCDVCVQAFKTAKELETHYIKLHTNRPDFERCAKCFQYVRKTCFKTHRAEHTKYYKCNLCQELMFNRNVLFSHFYMMHNIKIKKTPVTKNPGSRPRKSKPLRDKPTPQGYPCPDCNKYFESTNMRYKHILKYHREGQRCETCGKVFSHHGNLKKHEKTVHASIPREQCTQCGKFIRADFMSVHVLVHSERESFECVVCDRRYVSKATYDNHLKYSKAHAADNSILRFWCDECGKGFRSKGEIIDHIHVNHWGKTQHKCPVCDKIPPESGLGTVQYQTRSDDVEKPSTSVKVTRNVEALNVGDSNQTPIITANSDLTDAELLSSRRSITTHVQRVHQGLKETPKDKVCQICGKAFRLKKSLYEHQLIHSGDRPLSCDVCGMTFRQKASLYTHKKRVHKIFPKTKTLVAMDVIEK